VKQASKLVLLAVTFEGALGGLGWALSTWQGVSLWPRLWITAATPLRVTLALLPMLGMLAYATGSRWPPLADLRHRVERLVGELFSNVSVVGLAVVSIAAGVGEEVLFRGALQPIAERSWGEFAGLAAASLIFGLVHAVTRTYFLFATIVGLYLGWLAQHFDELATPIAVHALYDFVALVVLQRAAKASTAGNTDEKTPCEHGPNTSRTT
jgi:membrane protease YdiL (CAAX protease family)